MNGPTRPSQPPIFPIENLNHKDLGQDAFFRKPVEDAKVMHDMSSANSKPESQLSLNDMFEKYHQIQREVQLSLVEKAKSLAPKILLEGQQKTVYQNLIKLGLQALKQQITHSFPKALDSSSTEAFVASTVLESATRSFNSPEMQNLLMTILSPPQKEEKIISS